MENYLKIYPRHGFLNTEYKVRSENEESFTILFNGQKMFEGVVKAGETKILPKLNVAGEYIVISNRSNERQKICVEDALRLGSSDLKRAYVFDDFPYIIFVMKDRIHFYDPSIETYVYTENYLSPNDIQYIADGKLLFSTKHSDGTSLSIFNTDKLCIEESLETGEIIAHSKDYKMLCILDKYKSSVSIIRTENLSVETEFENKNTEGQDFYHVDNVNGLLYVVEDNYIYAISIDYDYAQKFEMNDNVIGVTTSGYLITYKHSQYEYIDLKSSALTKGVFKYTPFITDFNINGLVIKNPTWANRFDNSKSKKEYSNLSESFAQECREKIAKGDESISFTKEIHFDYINQLVIFYPTKDGVYVVECLERMYESKMTYYKKTDHVSNPLYNYRKRLVWITNKGYETSYGSGANTSPCLDDLIIKNEKALFKASSSLYLMLRNGEVISTFASKNDAADFIPSKETQAPIIIDGSEISAYRIVCRSENKLVCKNNNAYRYYELSNTKWNEIKTISFEEEKHTKAKMSSDGKYLVYSKGGNKYALYSILDQKEETVLTGNFVDFDKSGNLLFMEEVNGRRVRGRELKVYNPITFKWEKSNAQYYAFISPDGKLYAKTGLKSRYFNRLANEEISREEFFEIKKEYDTSFLANYTDEQKSEIESKRKSLVSEHKEYFESYLNENKRAKEVWLDNIQKSAYPNFSAIFLHIKHYVVVGVVDAEQELDIELNTTLSFLNYVAFSYDNKYVGIVGKPGNNGYLKLVKINYNEVTKSLSLEREICDTEIARWATWICAFTKNGLFGTYDSTPDLYLIKQSDFEKFNEENANDFNFIRSHFRIKDRSLLCFSPSGKLMALSNQGYEAKSLGGRGHVPSNDVYIYDTETREILSQWQDQGDKISFRNVANAGFSIDESKLMTVSIDGVIVVRNISEEVNKQGKYNPDYKLAIAS